MIESKQALTKHANQLLRESRQGPIQHVLVSMGTCGIAAGTRPVLESLQQTVTAASLAEKVRIIETGCMGLCHSEPSIEVVDQQTGTSVFYGHVTPEQAAAFLTSGTDADMEKITTSWYCPEDEAQPADCLQTRIALRNSGRIDPENIDHYFQRSGYQALASCLTEKKPQEVIDLITASGLRGRGGGGFPTGRKWQFAADQDNDTKYIICNADEGDPGAFMDRAVLEGDPHAVLEAMIIGGYAIGANEGIIYIRAEYPLAIHRLEVAIAQAQEQGLLGENILGSGFSFNLSIKYGAGAFVCGEETALISSIEGKRGQPTFKPPFPAISGLWGKPTIVNNVETLASIAAIIRQGAEWFCQIGTKTSPGTKVFALAGKVKDVGLIEVPIGTTLRDIIFKLGGGIADGKAFKAVQTGGPSGGAIPASCLDTPVDYESLKELGSMMGSGGMIVMDEDDCMVDIAKFFLDFTMDESCGKCTPCRVGGRQMYDLLDKITVGNATTRDIEVLKDLCHAVKATSLCGLGTTAPNPVTATLLHFADEYQAHVENKKCPAGKCAKLVTYTIDPELCVGCTACQRKCPVSCITGHVKEAHTIDQEACIRCGSCFEVCKFSAIEKQ